MNFNRRTGRPERAKKFLDRAVAINPLLWSAYSQLCEMGAMKSNQASNVFRSLDNQAVLSSAINLSSPSVDFGTITKASFQNHQLLLTTIASEKPSPKLQTNTASTSSSSFLAMEVDATSTPVSTAPQQPAPKRGSQPPAAPAKRVPFKSRIAGTVATRRGVDSNLGTAQVPSGSTSSISSVGSGSSTVRSSTTSRHVLGSVNPVGSSTSTSGGPVRRSQRLHAAAVKENNRRHSGDQPSTSSTSGASRTTRFVLINFC